MRSKHFQRGGMMIVWMLAIPILLIFGIYAVSWNSVNLAHAELQAAADAGALQGAYKLYIRNAKNSGDNGELNHDGYVEVQDVGGVKTEVDIESADDEAEQAARNALQGGSRNIDQGITITVERGHWEFVKKSEGGVTEGGIERGGRFTPNATTTPALLTDGAGNFRSFVDLNGDLAEINAVRVRVERDADHPVRTLFGGGFGVTNEMPNAASAATAVAYVGFAGTYSSEFTTPAPFAICLQSILSGYDENGNMKFNCGGAKFNPGNTEQIKWTAMDWPCRGAASTRSMNDLIVAMEQCGGPGVDLELSFTGTEIETTGGVQYKTFDRLHDCWALDPNAYSDWDGSGVPPTHGPDLPWPLTVPIIDCIGSPNCDSVVGAISVNVIWMVKNSWVSNEKEMASIEKKAPKISHTPLRMFDSRTSSFWDGSGEATAFDRWDSFVTHFDVMLNGSYATCGSKEKDDCIGYDQKAVYLGPVCNTNVISGNTGGSRNFGVRAAEPVLVY